MKVYRCIKSFSYTVKRGETFVLRFIHIGERFCKDEDEIYYLMDMFGGKIREIGLFPVDVEMNTEFFLPVTY